MTFQNNEVMSEWQNIGGLLRRGKGVKESGNLSENLISTSEGKLVGGVARLIGLERQRGITTFFKFLRVQP